MTEVFIIISFVSTIIMLIVALVFSIGVLFKMKQIASIETFRNCNIQVRSCRTISIVFIILSWLSATGKPTEVCFAEYEILSEICFWIACGWIGFALFGILICIFLNIAKRSEDERRIIHKLYVSSLGMGGIFLLFSFLLYVR